MNGPGNDRSSGSGHSIQQRSSRPRPRQTSNGRKDRPLSADLSNSRSISGYPNSFFNSNLKLYQNPAPISDVTKHKSADSLLASETNSPFKLTHTTPNNPVLNPYHNLNRSKSKSLPRSVFCSLQLQVQEIRAQLETLKSGSDPVHPEPQGHLTGHHSSTSSKALQYILPSNLVHEKKQDWLKDLPWFHPDDQAQGSARPDSNNTLTRFLTSQKRPKQEFFMNKIYGGTHTISSSPSTPVLSNNLPTLARPRELKIPQSHSLNSFHTQLAAGKFAKTEVNGDCATSELNKLFLLYEVLNTQEKIAKDLQSEIDTERENFLMLTANGRSNISSQIDGVEEDAVLSQKRLEEMNQRWNDLKSKSIAIRNCLENNSDHWTALFLSLRDLADWTAKKESELESMGPVAGDEASIRKQQNSARGFIKKLEEKRVVIENNLQTGKQLCGANNDGSVSCANNDVSATDFQELIRGIRMEVSNLSERWHALQARAEAWQKHLDKMVPKVHAFQMSLDDVMQRLHDTECDKSSLNLSKSLIRDNKIDLFSSNGHQKVQGNSNLPSIQRMIETINDQASDLSSFNVGLSTKVLLKLEDMNTRWKLLQVSLDDHNKKQNNVHNHQGPISQDFLSAAVHYPWARAISHNNLPYYINHLTETTHWDHPDMVNLFKSIMGFNSVRFSAYRTAMKLREIQKLLHLHHLNLNVAIEAFDTHGLSGQNDKVLGVSDMISVLSFLFKSIASTQAVRLNTPLCIDLTINWLLNVYDCQRTGFVRVLSFKIAILVFSQGALEEKYRYMFRLIGDQQRQTSERKLGFLLHDCLQIPRVLGEISAFGGSNVEPSVRSCFEKAGKCKEFIEVSHFVNWMKQEPQSMVWLPVLHRLIAAESASHQAKCNICKQSPIKGFRYRCLKCFNFDMCQVCFFAGKGGKYKNHKMTHPMQEYCTTTTSGEDMRDFTQLLKNKLKSKKYFLKNTKLGYLPVQTSEELEQNQNSIISSPGHSNPKTDFRIRDEMSNHYQNFQNKEQSSSVPDSPMQTILDLDADHRQELESRVRELECENSNLQAEYQRLKANSTSPTVGGSGSAPHSSSSSSGMTGHSSDADILYEAKMLREHKERLESRMKILAVHNSQLESQLGKLKQILQESNGVGRLKNGTLNTKSVIASKLSTSSPAYPIKMNENFQMESNFRVDPPALPPKGVSRFSALQKGCVNNKPEVPSKRSALTRSNLEIASTELIENHNRLENGCGISSSLTYWTNSLPDWEFCNISCHNSNSSSNLGDIRNQMRKPQLDSSGENSINFSVSRRRESSLSKEKHSFRETFQVKEKRNSTGNLHLDVDSIQSHGLGLAFHGPNGRLGEISSTFGHSQPLRVDSTMSINYDDDDCPQNHVSRELRTAAGDLGKELKNLITLMDQDDGLRSTWRRTIKIESPL